MERIELSEKVLQAFITKWMKERLQDLVRDLGPVIKEMGLDSKEVKAFIFSLLEQSLTTLKKMD